MTESARKGLVVITVVLAVLTVGLFVIRLLADRPGLEKQAEIQLNQKDVIGRIGEGYFNFEVANTAAEHQLGLSGRNPLPDTDALLFVFEQLDKHCFWMKDMKFSIDILWFDVDKKLVYQKRGVTPETYPENFCPDVPAKYSVEVTAGVAEKNQLKLGDKLDIEL